MKDLIKVIDDRYPTWMLSEASQRLLEYPVRFTNSPYGNYQKSRFFGTMMVSNGRWVGPEYDWFVEYLNADVTHDDDLLPGYKVQRTLLNFQSVGLLSEEHTDADEIGPMSVVYMVEGIDGDLIFADHSTESLHRIPFKENRMVIFPSHLHHWGNPPSRGVRLTLGLICVPPEIRNHP